MLQTVNSNNNKQYMRFSTVEMKPENITTITGRELYPHQWPIYVTGEV